MEAWRRSEEQPRSTNARKLLRGIIGLGQVMQRQLMDAFLAMDGEEDGGHQCHQRLIGADVGGALLPPNMLLAGREREHEAAAAFLIHGFAYQTARHLPEV